MKRSCLGLFLLVLFILTGCGAASSDGMPGTATPAQEGLIPTSEEPLVYDLEEKTISVYATVNGKHLVEPTRHGLNFTEGKYGSQAIFNAYANPLDFYEAMLNLGAEAGNNLGKGSSDNLIEGDSVEITVSWEGAEKAYALDEVIVDSTGKQVDFKFGGNYENAKGAFTGCLMCLDSCSVGITSNASHELKAFDNKQVEFRGNQDVLPEDGTPVIVTFKVGS